MLSREEILAALDLPMEEVQVPEWGGSVFVRTMTGSERDAFEFWFCKNPGKDIKANVLVRTICDENRKAIFTEADIEGLSAKSAAALDRCYEVATRLSRLMPADIEELKKTSMITPPASSTSASPEPSECP